MQFLKTLFWVVLAVIAAVFAFNNWHAVTIYLWGGVQVDAKLPVLLGLAFALGLLPMFVLHRATRWRLRRRLESAERALAEVRAPLREAVPAAVPLPDAPATPPTPLPPAFTAQP